MNQQSNPESVSDSNATGRLNTVDRRQTIAQLLRERKSSDIQSLTQLFGVENKTILTDLSALAAGGLLIDRQGDRISTGPLTRYFRPEEREQKNMDEKRRIAQAAAKYVQPGDIVLIDSGTTTAEIIPWINTIPDITIVTAALNIALAAQAEFEGRLVVLGGDFNRSSFSNMGPFTLQALTQIKASKLFLSMQGFSLKDGLTVAIEEFAPVKRAMIDAAKEVILLTDSSKWNTSAFVKVTELSRIHRLITDTRLSPAASQELEEAGIECELV